jgi:hypothetical protein
MELLQMKEATASFLKGGWFLWALSCCVDIAVLSGAAADGKTTDDEPKGSWHS